MHIVMVYDQNMNNRRTAGSKWLAVIMNKFRKRHSSRTQASFGEFYNGCTLGSAPQDVRSMRDFLLEPDDENCVIASVFRGKLPGRQA